MGLMGLEFFHPQDTEVFHTPNSLSQLNFHSKIKPEIATVANEVTSLLHICSDTNYLSSLEEFSKNISEYCDLETPRKKVWLGLMEWLK
jgi:hypothetical protein